MYMVFYSDECGLCLPMGNDPDCKGAIQVDETHPVLFSTIEEARAAVRISTAWDTLQKEQGEAHSDDFIGNKKNVRIRKVRFYKPARKAGE